MKCVRLCACVMRGGSKQKRRRRRASKQAMFASVDGAAVSHGIRDHSTWRGFEDLTFTGIHMCGKHLEILSLEHEHNYIIQSA